MNDISNYCKLVNDSLQKQYCEFLIKVFNENNTLHERFDNKAKPNFTQLNISKHKHLIGNLHDYLVRLSLQHLEQYKKQIAETSFWPKKIAFEEFRIKYYNEGGHDQFDEHIDSGNALTSKRYFIFFWYLNDVEDGGETIFTNTNLNIKPKQGALLMFPPFWMFPHKGNPVIKGNKYLLSSYLHYSE